MLSNKQIIKTFQVWGHDQGLPIKAWNTHKCPNLLFPPPDLPLSGSAALYIGMVRLSEKNYILQFYFNDAGKVFLSICNFYLARNLTFLKHLLHAKCFQNVNLILMKLTITADVIYWILCRRHLMHLIELIQQYHQIRNSASEESGLPAVTEPISGRIPTAFPSPNVNAVLGVFLFLTVSYTRSHPQRVLESQEGL